MSSYLIHFMVYSLAMVGVISVCIMIFKKSLTGSKFAKKNSDLCIENALNLSQRKTLYVIKAGGEKYLIAADMERTSFLAKLNGDESIQTPQLQQEYADSKKQPEIVVPKAIDYSEVMSSLNTGKKPMLKEMMRKLNAQSAQ